MEKVLRSRKVMFWAYAVLAFLLVYVGIRVYVVGTEHSEYESEVSTNAPEKVNSSAITIGELREYAELVESLHGGDVRKEWNNPLHIWDSTNQCYYDFINEDECYSFALSVLRQKDELYVRDWLNEYLDSTFGAVSHFRLDTFKLEMAKHHSSYR